MSLNVWKSDTLVGKLDMREGEPFFGFTYSEGYLSDRSSSSLSLSLPLSASRFPGETALPYFEGLLPEGSVRDAVAREFHVSPNSPAKLLKELGRDCAGDVVVLDQDEPFSPPARSSYKEVDGGLEVIAQNPLGKIAELRAKHRLSLAGGQEKVALYHDDREPLEQGWYAPMDGSPSNCILKPQTDYRFPHLALNEFICMKTAARLGIETAEVSYADLATPVLVIKRYDRKITREKNPAGLAVLQRIHQEDFCQALGIPSDGKYEESSSNHAKNMAELLVKNAYNPIEALTSLFRLMAFNYLIGNCDAHLKNYSLLHTGGSIRLAPAYDLLSTSVYNEGYGQPLSRSMGIRLGNHANIDRVSTEDIAQLARTLHIPFRMASTTCKELAGELKGALEKATLEAPGSAKTDALEIAERILEGTSQRADVLTSL